MLALSLICREEHGYIDRSAMRLYREKGPYPICYKNALDLNECIYGTEQLFDAVVSPTCMNSVHRVRFLDQKYNMFSSVTLDGKNTHSRCRKPFKVCFYI